MVKLVGLSLWDGRGVKDILVFGFCDGERWFFKLKFKRRICIGVGWGYWWDMWSEGGLEDI